MTADPHRVLAEALRSANIGTFRGTVGTEIIASRPWASATFTGHRSSFLMCFQGDSARKAVSVFLGSLAEREFTLPGHIVADIALVDLREDSEFRSHLTLEALIVEAD